MIGSGLVLLMLLYSSAIAVIAGTTLFRTNRSALKVTDGPRTVELQFNYAAGKWE